MSKEELTLEKLPDGSKIITVQGINQFGEKYIRQDRIKCPAVWDALKRLTYTAEDMEEFSFWYHCKVSVIGESELHLFGVRPFGDIIDFWKKERRAK